MRKPISVGHQRRVRAVFRQIRPLLRPLVRVHIRHFLQRQPGGAGVHDAGGGFQTAEPRDRGPGLLTFNVK